VPARQGAAFRVSALINQTYAGQRLVRRFF
jgi:hypothetical protein